MKNFLSKIGNKINQVINYCGLDKCLHFFVGAWMIALVSPLGIWWMIGAMIIVLVLSIIKEMFMDSMVDIKDIISGLFGALFSFLIWIIMREILK